MKELKYALIANATFSILNGFGLLFFSKPIAEIMGIPIPDLLRLIGIGLLLFAGLITWQVTRPEINKKQIKMIIIQDWLWVLGSAVILGFQLFGLSWIGYEMILIVAIVVGIFAVLQQRYLNNISIEK